jgi:uncharacterized C2H2 Zn-finger protein
MLDMNISKDIVKVDEGKYRCKKCSKLFKGEEYVRKHINAKHAEDVQKMREEVNDSSLNSHMYLFQSKAEYCANYLNDPFRFFMSLSAQPPPATASYNNNSGSFYGPRFIAPPLPFQTGPGVIPRIGFGEPHVYPGPPRAVYSSGGGPVRSMRRPHYPPGTRPRAGSGGRFNPYGRPPPR